MIVFMDCSFCIGYAVNAVSTPRRIQLCISNLKQNTVCRLTGLDFPTQNPCSNDVLSHSLTDDETLTQRALSVWTKPHCCNNSSFDLCLQEIKTCGFLFHGNNKLTLFYNIFLFPDSAFFFYSNAVHFYFHFASHLNV